MTVDSEKVERARMELSKAQDLLREQQEEIELLRTACRAAKRDFESSVQDGRLRGSTYEVLFAALEKDDDRR